MRRLMNRLFVATAALALSAGAALADFELNVLHFNDFHSRIEPVNKYDSICSEQDDADGKCFGGIARMKTAIDERRKALPNVLVLSAGDNFQGSLFYATYKGEAEAEFLDLIGLDANVIGNHEFDDGDDVLARFLNKTTFPTISGNALIGANSPLAGKMPEYVIKEVGGEKIAIVGAVAEDTPELSSPSDAILFMDPVLYLNDAVKKVRDEGATKVIALTHTGIETDRKIAAQVDGIDLIVGGHSNTLMTNDDDATLPYPIYVDGPSGQRVPIAHAYAYSKYLGEIKLVFADDGTIKSVSGDPILIDSSFAPDATMVARIKELAEPIEKLKQTVIAVAEAPIDGDRSNCRARECEMGNLVADAMLDRVAGQGVSIAIQNGGGLRASIGAGNVTMGEVLTVLPFQNTLATFQLKGSDVIEALENGVSKIDEGAGRFPQVAGLAYSFDPSQPVGTRTSNVMVRKDGSLQPIDPDTVYGIVSNNFMRGGGDGYSVFAEKATDAYDYGPNLDDVVAQYLTANSPYRPYLDRRITELSPGEAQAEAQMKKVQEEVRQQDSAVDKAVESVESHVVQAGDSLWKLAEKYLGDGRHWGRIADANPGQDLDKLAVGSSLKIPAQQSQ